MNALILITAVLFLAAAAGYAIVRLRAAPDLRLDLPAAFWPATAALLLSGWRCAGRPAGPRQAGDCRVSSARRRIRSLRTRPKSRHPSACANKANP